MFDEAWVSRVVSVMGTILEVGVGAGEAGDWVGVPGIVAVVVRVVVRRGDAGPTYRLGPPQHASQNVACNSLACLSKFEIKSLEFRGLWAVI